MILTWQLPTAELMTWEVLSSVVLPTISQAWALLASIDILGSSGVELTDTLSLHGTSGGIGHMVQLLVATTLVLIVIPWVATALHVLPRMLQRLPVWLGTDLSRPSEWLTCHPSFPWHTEPGLGSNPLRGPPRTA